MSTNDQFHDRRYSKLCIVFRSRVKLEWHLIYIFTFFCLLFQQEKENCAESSLTFFDKLNSSFSYIWINTRCIGSRTYRQIKRKKKSSQHYDEQLLLLNIWHHNSLTMLKGVNNRVVSYLTLFYLTMLYHIYYSILVKSFLYKKRQIIIFMFYRYV